MIYRFGACELDAERRELTVGGVPAHVEPQVFDVLRHLIENRDRVVSRDDLVDAVWQGRIVSDSTISARINSARRAVGDDGDAQAVIRTVPRRGFRFVAAVAEAGPEAAGGARPAEVSGGAAAGGQEVRFCRSRDGVRIAYAVSGSGPPVVKIGNWLTHLDYDWQSPVWRPFLDAIGRDFTLVRYDQRGNGLSDWEVETFSLDAFVDDLEAVVAAAGLSRFAVLGMSQGVPIGLTYAARHPEQVDRLALHGGFARGRLHRASPAEREQAEAYLTLMRHGWGQEGSQFIQAFASLYIPDATPEQLRAFVELQRRTTSPDNAVRLRRAIDEIDVAPILGEVAAPALITHSRNDAVHPFDEGRALAAALPNARFVALDSRDHVILAQDPAWERFLGAIRGFLGEGGG